MAENTEKKKSKYTSEDLKRLQNLSLDEKIQLSKARIIEFAEKMDNKIYVSFSGGKDSTVLAHLVHSIYPDVPLIFSNTGLEYQAIQSFAKQSGAEVIRPEMNFVEVLTKYGYPIISKEVAEAIYYARRIRNGQRERERERETVRKRRELHGNRYDSIPIREGGGQPRKRTVLLGNLTSTGQTVYGSATGGASSSGDTPEPG